MSAAAEEREYYLSDFEGFSRNTDSGAWLAEIRRTAIDSFNARGFPNTKDEEWRYTSVEPIRKLGFRFPDRPSATAGRSRNIFDLGEWDSELLTFVDGYLEEGTSTLRDEAEFYVGALAAATRRPMNWVQAHLAQYADYRQHAFRALNTAFMVDGGAVYVGPGQSSDKPIHLLFLPSLNGMHPTIVHPRNLIVVGDNSTLSLVESYAGGGQGRIHCTNAVTEVVLGKNAVVEHYRLQLEPTSGFHLGTVQVHQDRDSVYRSWAISAGAGLSRIEYNAILDGEGAQAELNGLYSVGGKMHADCRTRVEHRQCHTTSRELYKGILNGHGRAIFNGTVIVGKDAQKTDAQQSNRNLVLSDDAEVNSKPQLEISADDVRCSHGTTIGQLEEEQLFYLRSRGLGAAEARSLLVHGFAAEILDGVRIQGLRSHLEGVVLGESSGSAGFVNSGMP